MMRKLEEGLLVKEITRNGEKIREEILGVEMNEWDAKERIERASEYLSEQPFRYSRTQIGDGIAYISSESKEQIHFIYEKCIIITGGA